MKRIMSFLSMALLALFLALPLQARAELLMPNVGEAYVLTTVLASNTTLHLYCTDVTPADANTLASYTECTGTGYSAKTLTGGSWTVTPGAPTVAAYAQQTFTWSATGDTVYGYYVVASDGTTLLWAEKRSAMFTVTSTDDQVKVTPRIELKKAGE